MNKKELAKYINSLSKEELQKEIMTLHEKFDQVKNYFTAELSNDTHELLHKYKHRIEKEFQRASTRSSSSFRITEINNIIKEFEKVSVFSIDIIDLKLYRIELALTYIKEWHVDNQTYIASVSNHFEKALQQIAANNHESYFAVRTEQIKYFFEM